MLEKLLAPRLVFVYVAVLLLLTILVAPDQSLGERQAKLTSLSVEPWGARGLYQTLERLGWPVSRRDTPMREPLDSTVIYAVLAPSVPLTGSEVHNLLEAVRDGAGLLFALPPSGSVLADSLGVRGTPPSFDAFETDSAPPRASPLAGRFAEPYDGVANRAVRLRPPIHDATQVFVQAVGAIDDSLDAPVVVGLPIGEGRVVIVADPELLRNDFIRHDEYAILPVRLLEWLSIDGRRPLVFDEFHQGFGEQPSLTRAIRQLMLETPPGRTLAQITAALLILLLAAGARAIVPPPRRRTERRSPLEHVGALAQAYEQVEATRLATRRLVHGVRRRHATGAIRTLDDEAFLRAIAARHPSASADVDRTLTALQRPLPPPEFLAVGQAIDNIERTLRS